jgi:cytochrome c peroxidase
VNCRAWRRRWAWGWVGGCVGLGVSLCVLGAAVAAQHIEGPAVPAGGLLAFDATERARILSHGPWPVKLSPDAGNRVDGQAPAIELGRRLFTARGLSASGELSCASCHVPSLGFQDGRRSARHGRNTPSLLDAGLQRWYGWDGAKDSLWAASLLPLTAQDEMAATPDTALALLRTNTDLAQRYQQLFGVPQADELLLVNLSKALAAYQATLSSARTTFDDFRDALAQGDSVAAARYPLDAQRGLKLFVGAGRCFLCHSGPAFSNGEFADIGRPFFTPQGVDPGRWGGVGAVLASRHNRLGGFSDAPAEHPSAAGTRHVFKEPRHYGEFKVPGLRGLSATAPYFHDGSAATLQDVLAHYAHIDASRLHNDGANVLQALQLTPQQTDDLVAFLRSLSAAGPR